MTLKTLTPLLNLVLGQNVELGLCVKRMELREMLLCIILGPSSFSLTRFSYLLALLGGSLCDLKQGQGVALRVTETLFNTSKYISMSSKSI
jgi:hypothetical protein